MTEQASEQKPTRYTEGDIKREPALLAFAVEYAKQYYGEFEPMIQAADMVRRTGSLPVPIARVVLNTARHDAQVCESIPGTPTGTDAYEFAGRDRPRRLHSVPVPEDEKIHYPFIIENTVIKAQFWVPQSKQSIRAHLVNPDRSYLKYYPMADNPRRKFQLLIKPWCTAQLNTAVLMLEVPEGKSVCPTCIRIKEEG